MPKAIDFRVNGRLAITDDLSELTTKTAALSNIIAQLRALGVIGEFKTRIINTRIEKQAEEFSLPTNARDQHGNQYSLPPEQMRELLETGETSIRPDNRLSFMKMRGMQCDSKFFIGGEDVQCNKPEGHEDWHEGAESNGLSVTWPADRPAALPHPEPGGEPLKDRGPGSLEAMGIKPDFEYSQHPKVPRRQKDESDG